MKTKLSDLAVRVGSEYTFLGVLNQYYDEIFSRVKSEETKSAYNSAYNRWILPQLDRRPIASLTLEDYENVITNICRSKKGEPFKEGTLAHFRYLMRTVEKKAVALGLCEDVLFGTSFVISPNEDQPTTLEREYVKNPKSLKSTEEIALFGEIMINPRQEGEKMGLALMYALGLRNEEACAVRFSSIVEMKHHPGCYYAVIMESIDSSGSSNLGGKTKNMFRMIPVPDRLLSLIREREKFLREVYGSEHDLSSFFIACRGESHDIPCLSRDLTAAGRSILRKTKISEMVLAYIDREMQDAETLKRMGLREKDPTTYLLRRNLGTHLYVLGLSESEIQYIMGHTIENDYARNDFENEDLLYDIWLKMRNRPLFHDTYPCEEAHHIDAAHSTWSLPLMPEAHLALHTDGEPCQTVVHIVSAEPNCSSAVTASGSLPVSCTLLPTPIDRADPYTTCVLGPYHKAFSSRLKKGGSLPREKTEP